MSTFLTLHCTIEKDWIAGITFADSSAVSAFFAERSLKIALPSALVSDLVYAEGSIECLLLAYASCR